MVGDSEDAVLGGLVVGAVVAALQTIRRVRRMADLAGRCGDVCWSQGCLGAIWEPVCVRWWMLVEFRWV